MIDSHFQQVVNNELKTFFARKLKESEKIDKRLPKLIEQISSVTLRGGDRMRPYFCALGYQIATNQLKSQISSLKTIVPAFLALELTHTFALIHDDIMDKADTRRGGPTIHAYFTKNLRNDQLAISLGILGGDLAYLWAEELFDELSDSKSRHSGKRDTSASRIRTRNGSWTSQDDIIKKARQLFNTMREETIYGQIRDVWGMHGTSTSEVLKLYDLKSGRYSVEKPLLIGATLGDGDVKLLSQLSRYGRNVGMAFQIQDDILGVFGNKESIGKSTSRDIAERKWTVLISEMYNSLTIVNKKRLLDLFNRENMSVTQIEWVKEQIRHTGGLSKAEKIMKEHITQALDSVKELPITIQTELQKIAQFTISRKT